MTRPIYYLTIAQTKMLLDCSPHWPKVFKYAKLMEQGVEFPPVKIHFNKDRNRWEYNDGRNRTMAAKLANVQLKVKSKRIMGENKW